MLRVVLPPVALASLTPVDVPIGVPVEIIVIVDVDITTAPIAIAPVAAPSPPSSGTQRNSRSPHQSRSWHIARIGIRVVRILGRGCTINDRRVVRRHVNYFRVSWLNYNNLLAALDRLSLHFLLRAGF